MNILEMTKEDFAKVPRRKSDIPTFDSLVIIPQNDDPLHDSGYMCMGFVAVDKHGEPICSFGGGSDVICINGIGGYGKWSDSLPKSLPPIGWSIDCLPCGYLRLFAGRDGLTAGDTLSTFEIFSNKNN